MKDKRPADLSARPGPHPRECADGHCADGRLPPGAGEV